MEALGKNDVRGDIVTKNPWDLVVPGLDVGCGWQELNPLQARTWYLLTTKNQRDHPIHLSDFAAQQFTELANLREADRITGTPLAWVFPDSRGTGPVCIKSFGKQLADHQSSESAHLQNRTKSVDALVLEGGRWSAHDLRRTASP